uniref:class I SAM-dependent methyltransferase n=1 Tax=Flavobacterium sp. TaxID=239 RepID=UPI00404AB67D
MKDGIYFSKSKSNISYPEKGNDDFFKIEEESFWFKHRNNIIVEAVKSYSDEKVLFDIGGGNGYVSKAMEESGIEVALVEPGINGCLNAQKRKLKTIICSTLEDSEIKKNSIPNIGLFDVVEHIEDDLSFLKNVNNFLKPGGFVFITVPAFNILWSKEDEDAGHYRRYTINTIKEVLEHSGLQVKYATYIFSFLIVPIFLTRTLPSFLGFNKHSNEIKKHKKSHSISTNFIKRIVDFILKREVNKVKTRKKIMSGSSVFIIAKKHIK